ncbi:MAG: hypothetical protein HUU21_23635 [Polyangiaceae bacterium]|nr:hypothetical protein [Polyangiaceae bacterium]
MKGRACALLAGWLLLAGCSDRFAPDEAPPISSIAMIPMAPPGATGVAIEGPRTYGAPPVRPMDVPSPLPSELPDSLTDDPPPSPFVEPPSPPAIKDPSKTDKNPKPPADGSKVGPLPKGVQL